MGMAAGEYRKMLSALRSYTGVTEVYMSGSRWEEIDYTRVASRANLVYRNAFLLHDQVRRQEYLQVVLEQKAVVHAGVLMPHEIVARYMVQKGWRNELDPFRCLKKTLDGERYRKVEERLCS